MAEDLLSRTDMVRREALAEAVHWASHRSVPQTLEETLRDAETIEKWLLGETPAAAPPPGPPPGTLFVLSAGETHADPSRRRRGWTPQDPAQTALENWQELKRLDALVLQQGTQIEHLLAVVAGLTRLVSHPLQPQWLEHLSAAVFAGSVRPAADQAKTEGAPVCSSD